MDADPPPQQAPAAASSPLECNLAARTLALVQRLGLVQSEHTHVHSVIRPDAPASAEAFAPLVPLADLSLLLSVIPQHLVPATLPFQVAPAFSGASSRTRLIDTLARLALEPALTVDILSHFRPIAPALAGRWFDLLGLADDGSWRQGEVGVESAPGERDAVDKVFRAVVRALPLLGDAILPYLRLVLRHPLLVRGPLLPHPESSEYDSRLCGALLAIHSLLHHLPTLPAVAEWSLPPQIEQVMKTHPHRGMRLLAWRIVRAWLGLFAAKGDDLKRQWVWRAPPLEGNAVIPLAPAVPYPADYASEYAAIFGADPAAPADADDLLPSGFGEELVASGEGSSRLVEGGLEVLVRRRGVDPWILPMLEDIRAREERSRLDALILPEAENPLGAFESAELGKTVVVVADSRLVFREGLIPSLKSQTTAPAPSSSMSLSHAAAPAVIPEPEAFVATPAHAALLAQLAENVVRRVPTVITGSPSSGKQSVVTHFWNTVHSAPSTPGVPTLEAKRRGLVVINLADRSLDSKSLLGSLSSAPSSSSTSSSAAGAGQFTFVEGPLTRAIRQGRWTLLLNIDQAAPELLSVIKVVAERMHTAAASRSTRRTKAYGGIGAEEQDGGVGVRVGGGEGRWVKAAEGFMLFATRSIPVASLSASLASSTSAPAPTFFAAHFFADALLRPLDRDEVALIVQGRYGAQLDRVAGLATLLVEAWERVRDEAARVKDGGQGGTKREVGVRDLLRWCRRVAHLLPAGLSLPSLAANPTLQEEVFVEARDVFLGSLIVPPAPSSATAPAAAALEDANSTLLLPSLPRDRFSVIARSLATSLGLSSERTEWALRKRVPDLVLPTIDTSAGLASAPTASSVQVGRVSLPYSAATNKRTKSSRPYALTKPSLLLLEKLAVCLSLSEPVLLVGETGTGKTTGVQYLADLMGKRLTALNLSNQTEAGDLVGGFRPIDEAEEARRTASELVNRFVELFGATFSLSRNADFVAHVRKAHEKKRYARLVGLWREANRMAAPRVAPDAPPAAAEGDEQAQRKRRKVDGVKAQLAERWKDFMTAVGDFDHRHVQAGGKGKAKFVFSFVEGPLATAIRNGDWVLLDEVNLASSETLESLSTLLQAPDSSLVLTEQGDLEPIPRHPEFRLFACMNPATDVGKRDLPVGLRAKFSEIWVPPPDEDRDALRTIVEGYIGHVAVSDRQVVADIAELYAAVKLLALRSQIADGQNMPPHFSMRTLARALTFAAEFAPTFGLRRALYEGFVMAFTMLLDEKSQVVVRALIDKHVVQPAKNPRSIMERVPTKPTSMADALRIHHYWLEQGPHEPEDPDDYILTPSVQAKVCDLARAVLTRKVPVLIQGPTSAGKTSVVEYLAKRTGHRFVRINNHEHTDIQEYVGTYVSDPHSGKLVFQEGVLVRALRNGDWIVLDELNLAPTDVLEALNRLLDDNRELVIPETGEVVQPHPHFMLFATQNPPGLYGGRKVLSRAFRNRFLEMHFGDVPKDELKTILERRCRIAPSHAEKTVNVFLELQRRRQAGRVFEQKQAFATLRDLFRWGGRGPVATVQQLAEDGYMLLAERARRADDKQTVKEVLEDVLKVKIDEKGLYDFARLPEMGLPVPPQDAELVWTSAMRRLYFLIAASLQRHEPVLLVGETGAGKTSVCQALAHALTRQLHIVGCHQNTEVADLLGGQRPLRNRAALQAGLRNEAVALLAAAGKAAPTDAEGDFEDVAALVEAHAEESKDVAAKALATRMRSTTALFEWHDGPLVQAMRGGDLVLLDEISLADDSVLERLNSVLEPSRTLVLAEKGGHDLDDIRVVGREGFEILATMNPGGDFGKKELSPALRNRFTEIWVPAVDDPVDLLHIIGSRWAREHRDRLEPFAPKMLEFAQWLATQTGQSEALGIGLRDILGWVDFLNAAARQSSSSLDMADAFCQGALMTVVDGLGALPATSGLSKEGLAKLRSACWRYLEQLVPATMAPEALPLDVTDHGDLFSIGPFGVKKGELPPAKVEYTLLAPTTRLNAMRLLRALQLKKPVLLEGSPGVGKTSLVTAVSAATGHPLVRINLSDQTDLMDLLGSDLPVEGGKSGEFAWKDAPFLAAMQSGDWVLLDEMNLASQSVLEGLNSCLDHRGAVYIPELDRTFSRHPDFRIFAAQNPIGQGGGRKGLPKSFIDRFSVVHMEELDSTDLNAIAAALYPDMDAAVLRKMIAFNSDVHRATMETRAFGIEGSPWEFNLRDVLRWLTLIRSSTGLDARRNDAVEYFGLLYLQRFRNAPDRAHVARLFAEAFGEDINPLERPWPFVSTQHVQVGHSLLPRGDESIAVERASTALEIPREALQPLEALVKCLDMGWLAILTGPRATGKTALVRQVAALGGKRLREFTMNAEVDTLELLGSFEQADRLRDLDMVAKDGIALLKAAATAQLYTDAVSDVYDSLARLRQVRLELATEAADLDTASIASTIRHVLSTLPPSPTLDALASRLASAVSIADTSAAAARFEWVDGPLVQAMKNGDWLLVEDANLCSPSVLDRLNSLFETGGRLQLAERGPVNGEIQVIAPHPDFRLIMTLDPRNGELSRAMRNRGIEISILADSTVSLDATFLLGGDSFAEPALAPISRLFALSQGNIHPAAVAQQLVSVISPAHYTLALRVLRTVDTFAETAEFSIRQLAHHAISQHSVVAKERMASTREVPFALLALQPVDTSLVPLAVALESGSATPLPLVVSAVLEAFMGLLLSTSAGPQGLRHASSKATRALGVFDKSLLASHGKLKLDEADSTVAGLYPLAAGLARLVSALVAQKPETLSAEDSAALVASAKAIGALASELEAVSQTAELDFSTVQHVVAWIDTALSQLPPALAAVAAEAVRLLAPLRQSLTLTSGKAMEPIWRSSLPFKPSNAELAAAYDRLLGRGRTTAGEVWDKSLSSLFLEISVILGVPQDPKQARFEGEVVNVVEQLLARLPSSASAEKGEDRDPVLVLADASDTATLLVTELATVASVLQGAPSTVAASTLVKIVQRSAVVALADVVPLHQLALWPNGQEDTKPAALFATLLNWAEHLARSVSKTVSSFSSADIVRPLLLRKVVDLRLGDTPTLGNLVLQAPALARAASLQTSTAAPDASSRTASLRAALCALIGLVTTGAAGASDESADSLTDAVERGAATSAPLAESVERYLAQALPAVQSTSAGLDDVAGGFVAFARFLWHLYVPNLPLDPAVGLRAHSGFLGRQLSTVSFILATVRLDEEALTGNETNAKLVRVQQEADSLGRRLEQAGVAPVTREGNPGLLSALFAELRSFQEQIVSDKQLDSLLRDLGQASSSSASSREANLQRSVDTLLRRLDHAYAEVGDIVAPIRLALTSFKIGLALLAHLAQARAQPAQHAPFRSLADRLTAFPSIGQLSAIRSDELPLSIKAGDAPMHPTQATLLQIAALAASIANETASTASTAGTIVRVTQLYERLHYLWATDRRHAEEAAEAEASLYKAKLDVQQVQTDEELEAAEFAKLFPTFEDIMEDSSKAQAPAAASSKASRLVQPNDQILLAKLHADLFAERRDSSASSATSTFERLRKSGVDTLLPRLYEALDEALDRRSAVYRVRSLVELSQAVSPPGTVEAPHHDFYNEPNVRETARAVPVLLEFIERLDVLTAKWPEQMVLHALRDRCRAILKLSSDASIALVLTSLEQLLQHTEDWEKFADREHSVSANRNALIALIVEWRRLELTCWSRLLSTVQDKFGESVSDWWFRLYETAIRSAPGVDREASAPLDADEFYRDLVKILDSFMTTTSIGQFSARLDLVLSFGNYASQLGSRPDAVEELGEGAASLKRVADILFNVHAFYDQFSTRISSHLAAERARIDKDVQNVIKLASWKDINVAALRASAVRSHHQLHKCVRKLRAILQKPATDFFVAGELDKTAISQTPAAFSVTTTVNFFELPSSLETAGDAAHLVKLEQTFARLTSLASSSLAGNVGAEHGAALDSFAVQIVSTAKELREEPLGPEEGREQRVKNLVERKRRAWRDLLNELKRVGISPSPSPKIVARLEDAGVVYSLTPSHTLLALDEAAIGDMHARIVRTDAYHFRQLADLPTLKTYPASHHADVRTPDVQRALGHIQSGVHLAFDQRTQLLAASGALVRLDQLVRRLEVTANLQPALTARDLLGALLRAASQALHALNEARDELDNYRYAQGEAVAGLEIKAAADAVNDSIALVSRDQFRLRDAVTAMSGVEPVISTAVELDLARGAREHLVGIATTFATLEPPVTLSYILSPLTVFLGSIDVPSVDTAVRTGGVNLTTLKASHDELISAVLVVAQELKKTSAAGFQVAQEDELVDGAVSVANRAFRSQLSVFRVDEIVAKLDAFAKQAHEAMGHKSELAATSAILSRVAPFLRIYADLFARNLASFFDWHKASLKLNHVLGAILKDLATEGFCRPPEDDGKGGADADQSDGKTTEGTGMAEGTGAKNVSNEIEDESQLEGLQSDVPQEKREDEQNPEDGDDDAVEMNQDFDGDLEDRGDGAKEDGDEGSDDEEEQEDPEEQVADVDPLDPSSVDEKFWGDDEPPSDSKDGKTDEVNQESTKSAGEAEMGAKEDETPAPQPKGDEAADESKKEEASKDEAQGKEGEEQEGEEKGDEPEGGEGAEEEAGEGDEGEQAEQDGGDRLDNAMPEADNLDLPDDMNLDGDDKDKDAAEDEDLDLDPDMGDLPEDGGEGENDERPDQLDEMGDTKDEGDENDEDPLAANQESAQPEAADDEQAQDQALDQSLGGADQGETGGEGEQDASASKSDDASKPDTSKQAGAQSIPQEASEPNAQRDAGEDEDAEMQDDTDAPAPSAPSASGTGRSKQRAAADPSADPSAPPQPQQDKSAAEPQRSLGDALQNWRRRLEAIGDLAQPDEQENADAAPEPKQDGAVEYVQEGDEQETDEQALGPANEEQVKKLEQLHLGEETALADEFPDDMNVDEAQDGADQQQQPQQQPATMQLKGSSLTEADAKAVPASEVRQDRTVAEEDRDMVDEIRVDDDELPSTTLSTSIDPEQDHVVEQAMLSWRNGDDSSMTADGVWRLYESLTRDLSFALTEQLRLILEPTLATRLKGDYRSGKRLNMKKIIPYIASEFTKDKIWLRRTRPSQREYQILISIDDSKSMADSHSVHLAFQSLALISRALTRLEVGGVSICRFGESVDVLHPFEAGVVSDEAGGSILGKFTFQQRTTDVRLLVERSLDQLAKAKDAARSGKSSMAAGELWQLSLIVSDGICQDHDALRALLRKATEQRVLFVFVVVDSLHQRATDQASAQDPSQNSILSMKSVSYAVGADGRLQLNLQRYIDNFPFEHFIVLRDTDALPEVLSSLLRQFMESVSSDR